MAWYLKKAVHRFEYSDMREILDRLAGSRLANGFAETVDQGLLLASTGEIVAVTAAEYDHPGRTAA